MIEHIDGNSTNFRFDNLRESRTTLTRLNTTPVRAAAKLVLAAHGYPKPDSDAIVRFRDGHAFNRA